MRVFEVEIERRFTALVAAEDSESARIFATDIADDIARDCAFDACDYVTATEVKDLTGIASEPVYCEDLDIQWVSEVSDLVAERQRQEEEEEAKKPCKYTLSLFGGNDGHA